MTRCNSLRLAQLQIHITCIVLCAGLHTLLAAAGIRPERGDYHGCYEMKNPPKSSSRLPDGFHIDACLETCENKFTSFIAISHAMCHCLDNLPIFDFPAAICDAVCPLAGGTYCGSTTNPNYVSIYDTGLTRPGPVAALHSHSATNTSVTLAWRLPPHPELLGAYRITATVLHSFDDMPWPLPEWIAPAGDTQLDIVNLQPATTYNFTVATVSNTSTDEKLFPAAQQHTSARLQIGWPEPQPPQPRFLGATDRTRTVELPVPQNRAGPVTRVRLVVVLEDASLVRRDFDASRLSGFAQAQEEGRNYYVTAELEPYVKVRRFTVGDGRNYQGFVNEPLKAGSHVHLLFGMVSVDPETGMELTRYSVGSHEQHAGVEGAGGGGDTAASRKGMVLVEDGQLLDEEGANTLLYVLFATCILFLVLLIGTIVVYVFLRTRIERRMGAGDRRPSDQHELRPHFGGALRNRPSDNGAYVPDELTAPGSFERRLEDMLSTCLLEHQKIVRNALTLHVNNVLGTGKFGDVIGGQLNGGDVKVHVVADDMEPLDRSHFLNELDDVLRIMPHSNVLRFIGVCQTADWMYIVFEGTRNTMKRRLLDERSVSDPLRLTATSEEFVLRSLYNVAEALDFISNQSFRHRNLCAYNVCITVDDDVRLVTFGTTPCDEHGNRIDLRRWSSPEALRYQSSSRRSDVWSFGCLVWECCTLGGTLFPHIANADELGARLKAGERPARSGVFYDDIYQLMLNCWQMEQTDRPSFRELADTLRDLLASPRHVLTYDRRPMLVLPAHLPLMELEQPQPSSAHVENGRPLRP